MKHKQKYAIINICVSTYITNQTYNIRTKDIAYLNKPAEIFSSSFVPRKICKPSL